jgi:hypothetical protein
MGYLNKATITVDAILTNRGRQLLAESGQGGFTITKFAVADDEIDYCLYNVAHPQGSEYYGSIIENMPMLEATPDESQIMRYKLVSLGATEFGSRFISPTGEIFIPQIIDFSDVTLNSTVQNAPRTPKTNPEYTESYTLLVADARIMNIYQGTADNAPLLNPAGSINANGSITIKIAAGDTVRFNRIEGKTGSTTVTVFGDRTGATSTISVTIS